MIEISKIHLSVAGTNVARFIIAAVLLVSGFVKAIDPVGSSYKITEYLHKFGCYLGETLPIVLAIGLATVEFILGIYLLFGIRRRFTTLTTLVFLSVMLWITVYITFAGGVQDCGCFGDAFTLSHWQTLVKNIVLMGCAVVVFRRKEHLFRLILERNQALISLYSLLFIIAFQLYAVHYLPLIDFRPYKVGANISQLMEIPVGDAVSMPLAADFHLTNAAGDDVTEQVLTDTTYTFLLVSPQFDSADSGNLDAISSIYDYSIDHHFRFYAVSASMPEQWEAWKESTGAEYPLLTADEVVCKTIIRSNPGVVLIKGGTILAKWSNNNLPDDQTILTRTTQTPLWEILLWYILPVLLLTFVDRTWVGRKLLKAIFINHKTNKKK